MYVIVIVLYREVVLFTEVQCVLMIFENYNMILKSVLYREVVQFSEDPLNL